MATEYAEDSEEIQYVENPDRLTNRVSQFVLKSLVFSVTSVTSVASNAVFRFINLMVNA